jgi:hypothetical protein
MTAIDLSQLKAQAALLADNVNNPNLFISKLLELLEFYTNRTLRTSHTARRISLPSYFTPSQVLRQIERELQHRVDRLPDKGAILVTALWMNKIFECRLLAARLLGLLQPAYAIPLLTQIPAWLAQSPDKEIRNALLTDSLIRIRKENRDAFFLLLQDWLRSPRPAMQIWGMQALIPMLNESDFENLPSVFRILHPAVVSVSPSTQVDLQNCIKALERISQNETKIFLRDILTRNKQAMLKRMVNRMLPAFNEDLQSELRILLRPRV